MSTLQPRQTAQRAGVFGNAQPIYAAHGIATFPVKFDAEGNKVPAITNYQRVGLPGSGQLAEKFTSATMLGFMTSERNGITVLDVDSTDDRVFADALNRHGDTPVKVQTASGKFHGFYKFNGERRQIRKFGELPIDILGAGGFVVAPPSLITGKGNYEFIEGGLDDLNRLPTMRNLPPHIYQAPSKSEKSRVPPGCRNTALYQFCLYTAKSVANLDALIAEARNFYASTCEGPMDEAEIIKVSNWAWNKTLKDENWVGTGQRIVMGFDEFDTLGNRATLLLLKLRRHHWGEQFPMTKALAAALGWRVQNFKAARDELIQERIIECIHPGGRHPNDPPLYRFLRRRIKQ